jgi:hypothetical protein
VRKRVRAWKRPTRSTLHKEIVCLRQVLKTASWHGWITAIPDTVVTEWLTLNCRGLWACRGLGERVEVRFADTDDAARVRAHFSARNLWRPEG